MENEQYINIESGLSVGTMKIANKYEIFTEEEIDAINNKIPELDERVGVIEDEIDEINSSLDNMIHQFTNVHSMKQYNLKSGDVCKTLGYYIENDGGASEYRIVSDENIIANDIDIILLNNGLKAEFISRDSVEVKQFGAKTGKLSSKEDRIINKDKIQRCIDFCLEKNIKEIKFNGDYRVETEIESEYAFIIKPTEKNPSNILNVKVNGYIQAYNCNAFLIENMVDSNINIKLIYGGNVNVPEMTTGVQFYNCRNLDIKIVGDNFNGTLVKMGSPSKPVNTSTCSIDCYGGYRCLVHGEAENGRQQFFGTYSHIYYDNTTKGSIIYNSDDVHFLHFENRFIGSDDEHSLQIIDSTVRFSYLGLGERGKYLTYAKGSSETSVCTVTIDKYYCANKGNAYGLAVEGFIHCNVGYFEDSGCKIMLDLRNLLIGSFINVNTFMSKKLQEDRICVRDRGTDKEIPMKGGNFKLVL